MEFLFRGQFKEKSGPEEGGRRLGSNREGIGCRYLRVTKRDGGKNGAY